MGKEEGKGGCSFLLSFLKHWYMRYTNIAIPDTLHLFSSLEDGSHRFAERLPLVSEHWVTSSMIRPKVFYMEGLFTQEGPEGDGVPIQR